MNGPPILDKIKSVRKGKSGWTARCPAHEDNRSSLSISVGRDGRVLVFCHAGCTTEQIVAAVGLTMADLAGADHATKSNGKPKIVATYEYRDEEGRLLYQALRYEPKAFRQRKPKDGGGWEWNLNGVRRVPYRLPEIVSADPNRVVFVVEGEKDADALRRLGLLATCNSGGAGKWVSEFAQYLRGRKVVVLPDNDEPGRQHAEQIAASLRGVAAEVTVLALPGLPEKGDVSDWLNAGGTAEQLLELVSVTKTPGSSEKTEVSVSETPTIPWQPFPVEDLPEPVRRYVERSAATIGCDPAYLATAILPALAAAIGTSRAVVLKPGWIEPAVLWGVAVGDSGSQKSPAIDAATRQVRRLQAAAVDHNRIEREKYDREVELYKLGYEDWKRAGRRKGEPPPTAPETPVCTRYYCSDVTVEALAPILAETPRGVLLLRDELSGWISSFDLYKNGKGGADTAHWLAIHGARDLVVDRKTGSQRTIFVRRAAVSITGGIQPGTLRRVLGSEHFENGLAARLLLAMPPRRRKRWTETRIPEDLDRQVGELFDQLYSLQPAERDGEVKPVLLGLTQAGRDAWVEFYNEHAERLADSTGNEAAVLSKIEGAAARIALVLHLVRQAAGDPDAGSAIDERSVLAGVRIAQWFGTEAERVYAILKENDLDRERREILELIARRGGSITANDLRKRTRRFATNEAAEEFLAGLVKAGLGTWEPVPPGDKGGRPTRVFRLSTGVSETETPINNEENEVSVTETDNETATEQWEEIVL